MEQVYLLPINGVIGEDFTKSDVLFHLLKAKGYPVIKLLISSPGGYVQDGLDIRDELLKSGKTFIAENTGDVASIAVSIYLVASKENRTFDPSKGVFLIHNPYTTPEDIDPETALDSKTLSEMSKSLNDRENQLSKQYAEATGSDISIIKSFMDINEPLKPEQIEALGFAKIKTTEFKAVAYLNKNNNKMEIKELDDKISGIEKALNKVLAFFKPKAIMIQIPSGDELEFPELETVEQIAVGVKVNFKGAPATGEYVLADGVTLVCENGVVSAIKPSANTDALTAENATLKEQVSKLQSELDELKTNGQSELVALKAEIASFKALASSFRTPENTPPTKTETRKTFKFN